MTGRAAKRSLGARLATASSRDGVPVRDGRTKDLNAIVLGMALACAELGIDPGHAIRRMEVISIDGRAGAQGLAWLGPRSIWVERRLRPAMQRRTACHEAAHVALGNGEHDEVHRALSRWCVKLTRW